MSYNIYCAKFTDGRMPVPGLDRVECRFHSVYVRQLRTPRPALASFPPGVRGAAARARVQAGPSKEAGVPEKDTPSPR